MTVSKIPTTGHLVLVDFYATWCEPCKWVEPILNDVIKNFKGKIILQKIDIDLDAAMAREHHVLSVPTLVLFKNEKEVWRMRGFDTAPSLIRVFEPFL